MKKAVLYILSALFFVKGYSQEPIPIHVEGYFITKFLKKEILFKLKNEKAKKEGKSYSQMIDYTATSYVFTTWINSTAKLMDEQNIHKKLTFPEYRNIDMYKFAPFDTHPLSLFTEFPNIEIEKKPSFSDCPYYCLENDSTNVYRILHISGDALRVKVEDDYLDTQRHIGQVGKWNIIPTMMEKGTPSFYVYLFYKYDKFNCNPILEGFTLWQPEI